MADKGSPKVKRLSLGRYGDLGLEQARARVGELTSAARQGVDLIASEAEAREAASRAISMEKFVEHYLARRVRPRLRSAREVEIILKRTLAPLATMPAASVRRRDLSTLLEAIAARGHERAAGNARTLIGGLFRWGEEQDIVAGDPTRGLPKYDLGSPRDRVLDADEIRAVWPWLDTLVPAVSDILKVQLLLGASVGEVAGMTGAEVNRGKCLWTLPALRSKNGKQRVTPLVGHARELVAARLDVAGDGLLFPSETGAPLTSNSVGTALYNKRHRMPIPAFTSHDLRRTAASMMLELGIPLDVIGAIVGHGSEGDKSSRTLVRHYLKSDLLERKAHTLELWDRRLEAIIAGEPHSNVVQFQGGQSLRG